jgi:hypothetical protein
MIPAFLHPEQVVREDGHGPAISIENVKSDRLLVTLGITRIVEQESLDVSIWGSADGSEWRPLAAFPQKFYCGTYSLLLNLSQHPDVRYLRAQWKMGRWGRGDQKPLFGFYLFAEEAIAKQAGAA